MALDHLSRRSQLLPNEPLEMCSTRESLLTQQYLEPVLPALSLCLQELRHHIDAELQPRQPVKLGKPYPLGQCLEISQAFRLRLARGLPLTFSEAAQAGWIGLLAFLRAGGRFRAVWGDLRGQYFQNAFQLGTLYVDVANDTVTPSKPKIEILPFAEAGFSAITDFAHFRHLAQSYWQQKVFPNHVIPQLAPYCPFLHLRPNGLLQMHEVGAYMVGLAARDAFQSSETVLQEAALPDDICARVAHSLRHLGVQIPASAVEGRQQALKNCHEYRKKSRHRTSQALDEVLQTAMLVNMALARYLAPYAPQQYLATNS